MPKFNDFLRMFGLASQVKHQQEVESRALERIAIDLSNQAQSRDNEAWDRHMDMLRVEVDTQKYTVSQLNDMYTKTKSPAMKEHIRATAMHTVGKLHPMIRNALGPVLMAGPFSEREEKARFFEQNFGKGPSSPSEDADARTQADYIFRAEDYKRNRAKFVDGAEIDRIKTFSLGDGNFAIRGDDGVVNVLTPEQINYEKLVDLHGADTMARGGWTNPQTAYTEIAVNAESGEQMEVVYQRRRNVLTGEEELAPKELETVPGTKKTTFKATTFPESLRKLVGNILSGKKEPQSERFIEALDEATKSLDKGKMAVVREKLFQIEAGLSEIYPNTSFEILPKAPEGFIEEGAAKLRGFSYWNPLTVVPSALGHMFYTPQWMIRPIRGNRVVLRDSSNKAAYFYLDEPSGYVLDDRGQRYAETLADAEARASTEAWKGEQ